ncbi:hypothetical protein HMPREF1395_00862, partial [Helicobacter pylori GAM112Ai]
EQEKPIVGLKKNKKREHVQTIEKITKQRKFKGDAKRNAFKYQ